MKTGYLWEMCTLFYYYFHEIGGRGRAFFKSFANSCPTDGRETTTSEVILKGPCRK